MKSTSLSRMLNNLEKQGLIYRETSSTDKRSVKVFLTDLGREKRARAKDVVRGFNAYLNEYLSPEEREATISLLKRINQLAMQYGQA